MLKIIGIPTKDEALALYNEWKQKRDDWNKSSKRHDTILCYCTVIGCISAMIFVIWLAGWTLDIAQMHFLHIFSLITIPFVGFFIIMVCLDGQWGYDESSLPLKYKYYTITNGKTILKTKLDNGTVYFTLENPEHEVTTAVLAICKEKYRTDIDEIIVDLDKEEILIPYKT